MRLGVDWIERVKLTRAKLLRVFVVILESAATAAKALHGNRLGESSGVAGFLPMEFGELHGVLCLGLILGK